MSTVSRMAKKVVGSDVGRAALTWLAHAYIRIVWKTGRWNTVGQEHDDQLLNSERGVIVCFWHGRLMMMPYASTTRRQVNMVISGHRDGELIAKIIGHFGIKWIKGSTSKGGANALRQSLAALKRGEIVGITPDGPRGPRMRLSDGVIQLGRLSGAPILPVTFGIRRGKTMSSWDRFLLPWPFSQGCFVYDDPMIIPRDIDDAEAEAKRQELEDKMNALVAKTDVATGRDPVLPADPVSEVSA